MKKITLYLFLSLFLLSSQTFARQPLNSLLTVRGLAVAAPQADEVDRFVTFIDEEPAPSNVNTLILRVDYNYQYESRPELRDSVALSKADVKKLAAAAKKNSIPSVAVDQVNDMVQYRSRFTDEMKDRYYGVMHTVWASAGNFMDGFYENRLDEEGGTNTMWHTFRMMYDEINQLEAE